MIRISISEDLNDNVDLNLSADSSYNKLSDIFWNSIWTSWKPVKIKSTYNTLQLKFSCEVINLIVLLSYKLYLINGKIVMIWCVVINYMIGS